MRPLRRSQGTRCLLDELAMAEHDAFVERGRSLEEEYFRKKDRELIEKMRQAAAAEQARGELGRKTGLQDPALLDELRELGLTAETVVLLPLVPVLEVAWAEGSITPAERSLILELARSRGIAEGSAADRQLADWLDSRPDPDVFRRAGRLVAALLASGSEDARLGLTADTLISYCERIAAASGGILGIGRISAEERALLSKIAADLKARAT